MTFIIKSQLFSTRLLDKFYIIIYIFLYMKIIKYQWFLKIIQAAWGGFFNIFIMDS